MRRKRSCLWRLATFPSLRWHYPDQVQRVGYSPLSRKAPLGTPMRIGAFYETVKLTHRLSCYAACLFCENFLSLREYVIFAL